VREGVKTLADIPAALGPILEAPPPAGLGADDKVFLAAALATLPESFSPATWGEWTGALKTQTGRKGKELFLPLRRALTGQDHGPELAALLPVWGPAEVRARLSRCL